jgi:hypothetical protein
MRYYVITHLTVYYWVEQIRKEEMGNAYGLHGREEKYIQRFSRRLKKIDHLQELSVDVSILLKGI